MWNVVIAGRFFFITNFDLQFAVHLHVLNVSKILGVINALQGFGLYVDQSEFNVPCRVPSCHHR